MSSNSLKLGVLGGPEVARYSGSPTMHRKALEAAGLAGTYEAFPVEPEALDDWLEKTAPSLDGFNVTMPHKEAVYAWVRKHGRLGEPFPQLLEAIGALNTVEVKDGQFVGQNTDGAGFLSPFSEGCSELRDKQVLLLGAGGAAQAIAVSLAYTGQIGALTLWNRHPERAEQLAKKVEGLMTNCQTQVVQQIGDVVLGQIDLLVNATSAGMSQAGALLVDVAQLPQGATVYDIVYDPLETVLIQKARERNLKVITGEVMLAGQGAKAFEIWTGRQEAGGRPIQSIMQEALSEWISRS